MRHALLASLLLAFACADDGLTVRGDVAIDADGTPTGFEFVETTKLVDLGYEDSETRMAGKCVLDDAGASFLLQAPGAPPEGVGLYRFEVDVPTEGVATVTAQLGDATFGATEGEACSIGLLYRDDDVAAVELDCTLEGPSPASATAELHFGGCREN